jgi:uncharacterized membrane protein YdjX (TVP38/TMEM64 family)
MTNLKIISKKLLKYFGIMMLVTGLLIVAQKSGISGVINHTLQAVLQWIDSLGTVGYIAFILIYILATVFLIPGSILTLGAGVIFSVVKGSVLVSIASILAATVAFLIGRYLARKWVAKKIEEYPKFTAIDEAVAQEGWKIVGLTRLSPLFPFVFLNYAFSITKVSLRDYILASWIGMMPGTIMYVYLGSLIGSLANIATGVTQKNPVQQTLYIVGLVATVAVTIYVTKVAKKALDSQIQKKPTQAVDSGEL